MTVVSHEREPGELGYVARYTQGGQRSDPPGAERSRGASGRSSVRELGWAMVEVEMLRLHVRRRLSDRLDGITHGPEGSVDKLLMTWAEQAVGHAALAIGGIGPRRRGRHPVEHLPLQPGPERHGWDVADPAEPGGPPDPGAARLVSPADRWPADRTVETSFWSVKTTAIVS